MKATSPTNEHQLRLLSIGIGQAGVDGAHRGALLGVVKAHALGAARGVDHVEGLTRRDRLVGTDGLAGPAVDAVVDDERGHGSLR
jgi:hypothetical protein